MRIRILALTAIMSAAGCNTGTGLNAGGNDGGAVISPDLAGLSTPIIDAGHAADAADNGHPSNMYPAPHPAPPQVVTGGGPILKAPKIVPIFFSNDDPAMKMQIKDFLAKVGATKYWHAAVSEYGVGPATSAAPIELSETSMGTIDDSAIQTWLAGKLNANDPAFPPTTSNTIFAIHYPAGTTITLPGGRGGTSQSCRDFGGYHGNVRLDLKHYDDAVAYLVIPRCDNFGALTGIDGVTGTESHELAEAATDPYPMSNSPTYSQVDEDHFYWERALGGGENGDLCAQDPSSFARFPELSYVVQRTWSNDAANAGHDPCQPALANEVFFNSVPDLKDSITLTFGPGQSVSELGVQIANVGDSKTIDVDLFSDADTGGPWDVSVNDFAAFMGGQSALAFSLDRTSGQNGEKLHLTITRKATSPRHTSLFVMESKLGGESHYYFGMVGDGT